MYPEFNPMNPTEVLRQMGDQGVGGAVSLNFDNEEDKALGVRFYFEDVQNPEKSKEAGRPVYDQIAYCEIRLPGSTDVIRNVVSDKERNRFPRQYAAFQAKTDQDVASGTPLKEWPLMTSNMVLEARYLGVRTVEQLAMAPDSGIQRMGTGWLTLRKQARDWLLQAKDGALLAKLRAELEERDRRLTTLEEMLAKQGAALQSGAVTAPAAPAGITAEQVAQIVAEALAKAQAKPEAVAPKLKPKIVKE